MAQKKRSKRSRLLILPFTKRNIYDQTRELGGAFEHNLAPKDANMNEPFFKSSYVLRGGRGGKGMLKLQIDRRITDKKPNATCLNLLGL